MTVATRWSSDGFTISTEPAFLDEEAIFRYLHDEAYWSRGVPRETLRGAMANSLCFGLYEGEPEARRLAGFARVVTDRATFAWLCDVFVLEPFRGRGLATWLVATIVAHPDLAGVRRFLLATRDAHAVYARSGFAPLAAPERWMQRRGAPYGEAPR